MSFIDRTVSAQSEEISFEVELRHSPDKVWRALTDPALLAEWLLPVVEFELGPGGTFKLQAPPQPGWNGSVSGRFIEIEPQRKLSYAWVVGDLNTIVTFTLIPTASGTQLLLRQSGFKPHQKRNFGGARYGWKMMGGKLVELLGRIR